MATLIEILNSNQIVFLDTSAKGGPSYNKRGFLSILRSCQRYDYIDSDLIAEESEAIENFMLALQHPSSKTIKQVTNEIKFFQDRIKKEIHRLSRQKLKKTKGRENQQALNELYQKVRLVSSTSKTKEWNTQDPRYDLLSKMIILLNQELGLKKDTSALYCLRNGKQNSSETDERLVAASYYCSLTRCRPAVITGDGDFVNLFAASYPLLGSDVFLPYNSSFRCSVKAHFPKLYELNYELNYKLNYRKINIKSHNNSFPDSFLLFTNSSVSDETREKILRLWEGFNQTSNNNSHSITTKTPQKSL